MTTPTKVDARGIRNLVIFYVAGLTVSLANAFPAMLALGVVHRFASNVPALGYWSCVSIVWAAHLLRGQFLRGRQR